jgi:hypothetical protein
VDVLTKKLAEDDVTFKGSASKGRGGVGELGLNQFSRRYVFHLLARLTAFTEAGSGRADSFDKYVDRTVKNPFDIEHIWADDFASHSGVFASAQEFLFNIMNDGEMVIASGRTSKTSKLAGLGLKYTGFNAAETWVRGSTQPRRDGWRKGSPRVRRRPAASPSTKHVDAVSAGITFCIMLRD